MAHVLEARKCTRLLVVSPGTILDIAQFAGINRTGYRPARDKGLQAKAVLRIIIRFCFNFIIKICCMARCALPRYRFIVGMHYLSTRTFQVTEIQFEKRSLK